MSGSATTIRTTLGKLSSLITSGSRGWAEYYSESGALFLRMTNLPKEGIKLLLHDNKYVALPSSSSEGKRTSVKQNDILISITAELGKIGFVESDLGEAYVNQHVALVRISSSKAHPKFLAYYLAEAHQRQRWQRLNDPGAKAALNLQTINKYPVTLPPLEQQSTIAETLSVWDIAIEKTEKLIEAKEKRFSWLLSGLINQGRVKGKWRSVKLCEVADIRTGNRDNQNKVENGVYPFFVRSQTIERIDSYSFDGEAILIPGEGKIGEIIHYINGKFDYHQRVYKISDFSNLLYGQFLFYYLKFYFPRQAAKHTVKATADSLRLPAFTEMNVYLPLLKQQLQIAEILNTARQEIDLLKKQAEAYRKQKRGLMQKLLTGKWRIK